MAEEYYWSLSHMQGLESCVSRMHEGVNEALEQVKALVTSIESDSTWSGQHKMTFIAWMDLMKQFNAKLADAEVGATADQTLKQFINQLSKFYSDSPSIMQLRSVA